MLQKYVDECYEITSNLKHHTAESLRQAFYDHFGPEQLSILRQELAHNSDAFVEIFNSFDKKQTREFYEAKQDHSSNNFGSDKFEDVIGTLMSQGVVRVKGLIPQTMINHANLVLEKISQHLPSDVRERAGYVIPNHRDGIRDILHVPTKEDDGQLRMQSKTWKRHAAGSRDIAEIPTMLNIFASYNNLSSFELNRSTMEWIYKSKSNHNGWHRDMVVHRVKAMVLLSDCDETSAPFLYAKKSHRMHTEFDRLHMFDRFCLPAISKYGRPETWLNGRTEWPNYALKKYYKHCGYLSPGVAPNDMTVQERLNSSVTIAGSRYDLFLGKGEPGDVIFFDSCGLHSGSKAIANTRRNITFSSTSYLSPKNIFFNLIQETV